jgi:AraC family transcriptional regulator, melibiose operon regulatory protein
MESLNIILSESSGFHCEFFLYPKVMNTFDSTRPDFAPYGFTCERWTPMRMKRPDRHNEVELNLLERGSITYLLGGNKVTILPGLNVFWAAIPHQIIASEDKSEYLVATLPLAWFLQCRLPDRLVTPILEGQVVSEKRTSDTIWDWRCFERWAADLKTGRAERKRIVLLEIEARLLRMALNLPSGRSASQQRRSQKAALSDGGLNKVEQIAAFIALHYTEPLTVDQIGAAVGLHPNYAMTLFKRVFGTTLIDYLTQHRISHTQRLLVSNNDKILNVALSSGFNSISRFNDAFKKNCGCSPKQYRRIHTLIHES